MAKVKIYKLENDGTQTVLATCSLLDEKVICEGDEKFIAHLKETGIADTTVMSPKQLFFSDGRSFLEQLRYNFTSGYLNASEIIEE